MNTGAIAEMDRSDDWKGYNELITAAFVNIVDQRFGARYTLTDIVEYVAEVRTRLRDPDRGINPNVAERLIRKALGEGTVRGIDKKTLPHTEGVLLVALTVDEQLDDAAALGEPSDPDAETDDTTRDLTEDGIPHARQRRSATHR